MESIAHRALSRARRFLVDVVREGSAAACDAETDRLRGELREANAQLLDFTSGPNAFERNQLRDEVKSLTAELARLKQGQDAAAGIDIEPTWVCALLGDEFWSEKKRCSYDSGVAWMHTVLTVSRANLPGIFPRSAWDTLVRLGRAR